MASNLQNRGIVFSSTIAQDFDINYSMKINEFSTEFATAHDAKPRTPSAEKVNYYALIFNKFFPADLDKINSYKAIREKNIQEMIDFGKIQTNKGEALCCIFKKPIGVKISEILKNGALDENFVTGHLLSQLFAALSILHSNNIMHGSINFDYVYLNSQDATLTLRECVSEFVGFSQKPVYETFERMITHPAGKSYRDFIADYYAMGILLAGLIMGQQPMTDIPDDLVKKIKFENGSYDAILNLSRSRANADISAKTEILLKGLLHDKSKERWVMKQVSGWQKKEVSQPSPSRVHRQAASPFIFEGIDYYSPKYLAHILQQNWVIAKKNLKLIDLIRWISFTSRIPDVERRMNMMTRAGQTEVILPDDKLARILYLLDEEGPIRYKDASFQPEGLGNIFAYYLFKNDQAGIENLSTIIDLGFIEGWIAAQENQELYKPASLGYNPKKVKSLMRKNELGFGTERCLYELNPYLPCLSPVLESTYSVGLPAVLSALNQGRLNNKEIENDWHLTSYICSQIDIEDSIRIKSLQNFPYFNRAMPIKISAMFAFAQQKSGIDKLPGIATWLKQNLKVVTDKLNSANIKKKISENLDLAVATGDLNKVFASISDANMIKKDVYGFQEAKRTYKILTFEILKLKSSHNLDQLAYRAGLRVAVILSYLICTISILGLIFKTL